MKVTQKALIESSNIPASLIRSVVRQSGGWQSFTEIAHEIRDNGVQGGFRGWIYHSETCKFFKKNRSLIMLMAELQASDQGVGTLEMIQNFGVFRNDQISVDVLAKALYTGEGDKDDVTVVHNVMAWYAAEEVARAYNDLLENV